MGSTVWSDPAARPQALATIALVALAVVGGHLAAEQARAVEGTSLIALGLVVLGALIARATVARSGERERGWVVQAIMVGPLVLAFLPVPTLTGVSSNAGLEYRLLAGLRNVALVGAVLADRPRAARTAVGSSLAVMLFAFSLGKGWAVFAVATLFAAVCVTWLVFAYWREFAAQFPPVTSRRPPTLWAAGLGAVGGLSFVAGVLLYPAGSRGWLEQLAEPNTTEGQFEDAARRTLQDANRRAVADLSAAKYGTANASGSQPGKADGDPTKAGPASANKSSQQTSFPLTRAPRTDGPAAADQPLFQLQERGPRHVPLVTYDQFDGTVWQGDEPAGLRPQAAAEVGTDKSWLEVVEPLDFNLAQSGTGAGGSTGDAVEDVRSSLDRLTLGTRGGRRVVAPQQKPLDRDKLLRLLARSAGDRTAPDFLLTPADQERIRKLLAEDPDLGANALEEFNSSREFREAVIRRVLAERTHPLAGLPSGIRTLVEEWTAGRPQGWGQIDGLVQGLRGHARYDPTAVIPPGESNPLRYFLLESRRGSDYMFATAAAVLLRHLDYPTRLVGGFYARPDEYSRLTGTTTVRTGDIHYWTQVRMSDGTWVNLEPTPGYEPTAPVYTPVERATRAAAGVWEVVRRHWTIGLAVILAAVTGWVIQRRLAERVATLWWRLRVGRRAERLVPSTWRLLERRAAVAGAPRRPGMTLPAWANLVTAATPERAVPLTTLAAVVDHLIHAPATPAALLGRPDAEIRTACRLVVRDWTVTAFRHAPRSAHT